MEDHIDWLKREAERARREAEKAQRRYETLMATLRLYETGETTLESDSFTFGIKERKKTIVGLAEEILRNKGPLSTRTLLEALTKEGKETTLNSLTVSLNLKRPEKFDRDELKRWYLVTETETDDED